MDVGVDVQHSETEPGQVLSLLDSIRFGPVTYWIVYLPFRTLSAGFAPEMVKTDVGVDVQHAHTEPDQVQARHLCDHIATVCGIRTGNYAGFVP